MPAECSRHVSCLGTLTFTALKSFTHCPSTKQSKNQAKKRERLQQVSVSNLSGLLIIVFQHQAAQDVRPCSAWKIPEDLAQVQLHSIKTCKKTRKITFSRFCAGWTRSERKGTVSWKKERKKHSQVHAGERPPESSKGLGGRKVEKASSNYTNSNSLLFLIANTVTTSKAPVTTSVALVPSSFLLKKGTSRKEATIRCFS